MDKDQFLASLNDVYCRLDKTVNGVGVVAVRKIPKGVNPFKNCEPFGATLEIPATELEAAPVPESAKKIVRDFFCLENGLYFVSDYGVDAIDKSFFLNHSYTPNMETFDDWETFLAAREIEEGEELTSDYRLYGQPTNFKNSGKQ